MGAIAAVRLLLNRNAHVRILLDNEEVGVSKYDPNISDPDHSGARDGCLWEVSLMLESHHPAVTKVRTFPWRTFIHHQWLSNRAPRRQRT